MSSINKWNVEKLWEILVLLLAIIPAVITGILILNSENKRGEAIAFAVADPEIKRIDVAKSLQNNAYRDSGWWKFITLEQMPISADKIKAWAFDADTGKAFELNGTGSVAK